jgi:hypothetical protein
VELRWFLYHPYAEKQVWSERAVTSGVTALHFATQSAEAGQIILFLHSAVCSQRSYAEMRRIVVGFRKRLNNMADPLKR